MSEITADEMVTWMKEKISESFRLGREYGQMEAYEETIQAVVEGRNVAEFIQEKVQKMIRKSMEVKSDGRNGGSVN